MEIIKDVDKRIKLKYATKRSLQSLAYSEDISLKRLIENELEAMGEHGLTYRQLWERNQTTAQKLKGLSSPVKGGNSKN